MGLYLVCTFIASLVKFKALLILAIDKVRDEDAMKVYVVPNAYLFSNLHGCLRKSGEINNFGSNRLLTLLVD